MTREQNTIVRQAIKDSELNGYKWTISGDTLKWNYCDTEFKIEIQNYDDCIIIVTRYDDETFTLTDVEDSRYSDARTFEEGLYKAIKKTIYKANYLF